MKKVIMILFALFVAMPTFSQTRCSSCSGYGYVSTPHHLEVVVMGNVYQGTINLKRTISGTYDRFPLYNYRGTNYVKVGSSYINISGTGTVNINNIKYNKP